MTFNRIAFDTAQLCLYWIHVDTSQIALERNLENKGNVGSLF
jgi:hypothetical protein